MKDFVKLAEELLPCIFNCLNLPHKQGQDADYHFACCPAHYRAGVVEALEDQQR